MYFGRGVFLSIILVQFATSNGVSFMSWPSCWRFQDDGSPRSVSCSLIPVSLLIFSSCLLFSSSIDLIFCTYGPWPYRLRIVMSSASRARSTFSVSTTSFLGSSFFDSDLAGIDR